MLKFIEERNNWDSCLKTKRRSSLNSGVFKNLTYITQTDITRVLAVRDVARRNRQRGNVNVTSLSRSNALPVCSPSFGRVPEVYVAVTAIFLLSLPPRFAIGSPFFCRLKKKKTFAGENMRTESQNPVFSCYFPCLVIIVIIHPSRAHSDTLKLSRSKLRNCYFEILLSMVIDFKSHQRDSYLWIFRLVIWTNSHRETCRSDITRQVRCEDYSRIHSSTPLQVAALISRVAKKSSIERSTWV